jgi:5'-deoxynucleotidase YfbR-like HD superfamily hydrolase
MRSGRSIHLFDPSPLDVDLNDWVLGCSRVNRWGGQTKGEWGFNDLVHMLLVEQILSTMVWPGAPMQARLFAMLHDLHEGGGLGDICTPYGQHFASAGLKEIKARLDRALFLSQRLPPQFPPEIKERVKQADVIAAVSEAVQLVEWPEEDARRRVGNGYKGRLWPKPIECFSEVDSRTMWLARYRALGGIG